MELLLLPELSRFAEKHQLKMVLAEQQNFYPDISNGTGPFATLGEQIFDDYWMYYLTEDMARAAELPKRPYTNLTSYLKYKGISE